MDFTLPQTNWKWYRLGVRTGHILAFSPSLTRIASFHDDFDGAENSNEKHGQSLKTSGTIYEVVQGVRVRVMVSYIDDDIQAQSAMSGDRLIHGREQYRHERFELRALSSRTQTDPGTIPLWRDTPYECIYTQIHPWTVERLLNHGDNARLTRSWGAIQNDNLPWLRPLLHGCSYCPCIGRARWLRLGTVMAGPFSRRRTTNHGSDSTGSRRLAGIAALP
jgi:hypothetical protein